MNKSKERLSQSAFKSIGSASFYSKKSFVESTIKINPQDEVNASMKYDNLIKMINFDNGNALKDCKAILDNMKDQLNEDKQRLGLFYKEDSDLLSQIDLKHISLDKVFTQKNIKQMNEKINKFKFQKTPQVLKNYNNLMKHSLRQNQKFKFLKQAIKKNKFQSNIQLSSQSPQKNPNQRAFNKNSNNHQLKDLSETVLSKFIKEKKNQMAIQSSSKLNLQQKKLQQILKNRNVLQKILEQALMLQRYYDILKKEKNAGINQNNKSMTRFKTQPSQQSGKQNQKKISKMSFRYKHNKNKSYLKVDAKQNSLCTNPRHLRLVESESKPQAHKKCQQDYYRSKYIHKLKRDQYYNQINRVNDQFVQKRNYKNNILIANLISFARNNSQLEQEAIYSKFQVSNRQRKSNHSSLMSTNNNFLQKQSITGSTLTKVLRKLFLIYSYSQAEQLGGKYQPFLSRQNVGKFLKDFEIQIQIIQKNNQKIKVLIFKQNIDQFQFIQLIHLLSIASEQSLAPDSNDNNQNQGIIYTNINQMVVDKILNQKYAKFLAIEEEIFLKQNLKSALQKLRRLNRVQKKISNALDSFMQSEKINKLLIGNLFSDFDYLLQILWFLKIYPTYINKKTLRFYHQYLNQQTESFIFKQSNYNLNSRKDSLRLQNVIWFIIAKVSIEQLKLSENQVHSTHLQTIFFTKFKIILKLLSRQASQKSLQRQKNTD